MYEDFNLWVFLSGLPLGLAIAGILMLFSRRKMKKARAFDERHATIQQHGRSVSWMVTTVAILIAWMISIMTEGPQLAFFLLFGIWVLHMLSYAIGIPVASSKH